MKKLLPDGKTLYIVCNSEKEVYPRNILRIYTTKESAYQFLGKYVSELRHSMYTGFLSISEKKIGANDDIKILGQEGLDPYEQD
ncbi:MAG: hypothetical protein MSC43_02465 [Clostridiales bacterium]|nr:hypothetical protein [Clostridiales bacterium]